MLILLYIIVSSASDACGAGPMIYGPECTATMCEGPVDMIYYKIDKITFNTNLECMGWAWRSVPSCKGGKFDWFPLGIMSEGDESPLYWGPSDACPQIKCKGQPLPTTFEWSWRAFGSEASCCGETPYHYDKSKLMCCGETLYNPKIHDCCFGILFDLKIQKCCYGYDIHRGAVNTVCKINDDCCHGAYCCPNTCCIDGVTCCDLL